MVSIRFHYYLFNNILIPFSFDVLLGIYLLMEFPKLVKSFTYSTSSSQPREAIRERQMRKLDLSKLLLLQGD